MPEPERDSARLKTVRSGEAPASAALGYLLNYLSDASKLTGYMPPRNPPIREILDENGVAGHEVVLSAPKNGFAGHQKEAIEAYAKTLTYWRNLLVEVHWGAKDVTISFTRPPNSAEEEESVGGKLSFREKLKGRSYRAVRFIGQVFVDQGFMVREPVLVTLLTISERFGGYAIMLKYPTAPVDEAGISLAYDKWIPLMADSVARVHDVKSECQKDGLLTTIFFTANKRYVSSLYETSKQFRIFVPKPKSRIDLMFFTKGTYRACRALSSRYKKDFDITKKPLPAWGVAGHSLVMNYKKGAGGRVVDDSYLYNVRLMTEKLMKKHHLQGSIKHLADTKSLIVTFYSNTGDRWMTVGKYAEGVAVVSRESEEPATL